MNRVVSLKIKRSTDNSSNPVFVYLNLGTHNGNGFLNHEHENKIMLYEKILESKESEITYLKKLLYQIQSNPRS